MTLTEECEMKSLIDLIQKLEALRREYTITFEGLAQVVELMKEYAWETEKYHPLKRGKEEK